MVDFTRIYGIWDSAEDLGRAIGVPGVTVRNWRNRSRYIPVEYWPRIRHAARKRGSEIPLEWLAPDDVGDTPAEAERV